MNVTMQRRLKAIGYPHLAMLAKRGLDVHEFTENHFRVAGRFDIFPTLKSQTWAWHDIWTKTRGAVHVDSLVEFVLRWLAEHKDAEPREYVPLTPKGWWNCPFSKCGFKMRDDGTSVTAKRISEHVESHD